MKTKTSPPPGRLVSLEGACSSLLREQARELAAGLKDGKRNAGVSVWDASGVLFEMEMRDADVGGPSAKTLMLLYAADLAFRLRWQIRPALVEGRTVIAAPYVDSFVALGKAFGVSRRWLVDLFLFAPAPDARFRIDEPEHPPRGQAKGGYVDYAARLLNAGSLIWDPMHVHKRVVDYLEALERRGGCAKPDF